MNWDSEKCGQIEAALGMLQEAAKSFDELVAKDELAELLDALDRLEKPALRGIVLGQALLERQHHAERRSGD